MKKFSVALLAGAIVLGLTACDKKTETTGEGQTAAAGAATTATDTVRMPEHQAEANAMTKTTAEFSEVEYDFGTVKEGTKVKHTYKVKNTGSAPLKITQVKPSCGCTASSWTKEEIAPGATGDIEIELNTAGKNGTIKKSITVTGNFSDNINKVLYVVGEAK